MSNKKGSYVVYCKCGQKIEPGWKFCTNCQNPINFDIKNESKNSEQTESLIYIFIYSVFALIYFLSMRIPYLMPYTHYSMFGALITIITGKIKCPYSVVIKVLFWLTLGYFIFIIVLVIWVIMVCSNSFGSCLGV